MAINQAEEEENLPAKDKDQQDGASLRRLSTSATTFR